MKTGFFNPFASVEEAQEALEAEGYRFHHSAMERGYLPAKNTYVTDYKGKFGEGYVLHIPNQRVRYTERLIRSNRYHPIDYWTK